MVDEIVTKDDEQKKDEQKTAEQKQAAQKSELSTDETLKKKIQELENKWLYLYADFENYKKRVVKEKADLIQYGNEVFAREIVEVIDSLESALNHASGSKEVKALEAGILLTVKKFVGVLEKFGIKPMESIGKKFDPRFHEAISEEVKVGVEPGTVISEHQKGYTYHDRLLRVARVIVSKV